MHRLLMMLTVLPLLGLLLAGCGSMPKMLENRAACTLDGAELHVLSKWGPFSVGSKLAPADAAVVCAKR